MVIVRTQLKNGKVSVTSSCFEDIRTYRMSLADAKASDYVPKKWRKEAGRDFSEATFQTVVQCMLLAKKGLQEIAEFQSKLKPEQFANYKFNYGPCKTYESYEDLCQIRDELEALPKLDEDQMAELDRVNKEIKSIDDFVAKQVEAVKEPAIAE